MKRGNKIGAAVAGIAILLVLISQAVGARVDFTEIGRFRLDRPAIDIAVSDNQDLVFVLTDKEVVVYSPSSERIETRIPVDGLFDRVVHNPRDNTLALSSARTGAFRIIRLDKVYDIDASGLPVKGPAAAPVTVAVFNDYQWIYCARLEPVLQQLLEKYPNDVKLAIVHFPLEGHEYSMMAAKAALAANLQGKFWEFHLALFEDPEDLNDARILEIANFLNLDMEKFEKDRNSAEIANLIEKSQRIGRKIGVNGTPVIFVNGKVSRRGDLAGLSEMVEESLKKGK